MSDNQCVYWSTHTHVLMYSSTLQYTHSHTHVLQYTQHEHSQPAPMNHVKYLRAGPAEMPFQNWYTATTNHCRLTDFCQVEMNNTTELSNKHRTS